MNIMNNISTLTGAIAAISFVVNIIVQLTKEYIPLPTKLWVVIVSVFVDISFVFIGSSFNIIKLDASTVILSVFGSFLVAYIAMYGFDTLKELWERFKGGENINEIK